MHMRSETTEFVNYVTLMRSAKPRLAYSSNFRVSQSGNQPSVHDFRRPVLGFQCFCVTGYAAYIRWQVNPPGYPY